MVPLPGSGRRLFRAGWAALLGLALLCAAAAALAQTMPAFPPLTGRVVDAANILDPASEASIAEKLKAHEERTTDQLVVATVPTLGELTVEDYANRLFRHWGLGQKEKNNGALLLVAPTERKVRIEVGYGLEGALTDALSKIIISTAVAPRFRQGDFAGGIAAGVDAILAILTGDAEEWQRRAEVRDQQGDEIDPLIVLILFLIVIFIIWRLQRASGGGRMAHRNRRGRWVAIPAPTGGGWGGGGWSGGGSFGGGGGFSGGGGSSGGGGASGDW